MEQVPKKLPIPRNKKEASKGNVKLQINGNNKTIF